MSAKLYQGGCYHACLDKYSAPEQWTDSMCVPNGIRVDATMHVLINAVLNNYRTDSMCVPNGIRVGATMHVLINVVLNNNRKSKTSRKCLQCSL